ncbi:MAG: hypothetical protein IPM23_04810 [Candidatus Melainabacteria bacterium]|nr:hypothetical protein [Candidatus Melainabacteria bacterium]
MKFKFAVSFAAVTLLACFAPAADAQVQESQGATGVMGRSGYRTNMMGRPDSVRTRNQRPGGFLGMMMPAGLGGTARVFGPRGRNGLPVTSLDSFVLNAGGHAEHIYGDEGANGLPPYEEFTKVHRIEMGIQGSRDAGITTGHGSTLPDAWGGDEFVDGPEFTHAGHNGGFSNNWRVPLPLPGSLRPDFAKTAGQYGSTQAPPAFQQRQNSTQHNSQMGGNFGFNVP